MRRGTSGACRLGVPVRNALALAWGMPREAAAYFRKGRAFEFDSPDIRTVVRYGRSDLLLSGWLVGEEHLAGKPAVVAARVGRGTVLLLGFPAYFRGQPAGTFKLFLNALYLPGPGP